MSNTLSPRRRWLAALGLAPLLQACSPIRLINATVPSNTHTVLRGEAYGSAERQRMDVYRPGGAAPDAPMAVFFYGGSWSSGERADYKFVGEALASPDLTTSCPSAFHRSSAPSTGPTRPPILSRCSTRAPARV